MRHGYTPKHAMANHPVMTNITNNPAFFKNTATETQLAREKSIRKVEFQPRIIKVGSSV